MNPLFAIAFLATLAPQAPSPSTGTVRARRCNPNVKTREVAERISVQVHADGRWILVVRKETPPWIDPAGEDMNGDGDRNDYVLWLHDVLTGATMNLGLANSTTYSPDFVLAVQGGRALVAVRESSQGQGDLNGDGDTLDEVLFGVDLASGVATNSGYACQRNGSLGTVAGFLGSKVLFTSYETTQGIDLNGNGSLGWSVPVLWESFSAAPTPLPVTLGANGTFGLQGSWLFSRVPEAVSGDRNFDGDTSDYVLHGMDLNAPIPVALNLQVAVADSVDLLASGSRSAFLVHEGQQRLDLNQDGDRNDLVLHTFDPLVGLVNLGFAVGAPSVAPFEVGKAFELSEDLIAFNVPEVSQGRTDLNADGDTTDHVLHVHEFAQGATRSLGTTAWWFKPGPGALAFTVSESKQGADLDGDGNLSSHLAFLYSSATGSSTNLGVRTGAPSQVTFTAREPFTFGASWLATEGDAISATGGNFHLAELTTGLIVERVSSTIPVMLSPDGHLGFGVSESASGHDLNGDGDILDQVHTFTRPGSGLRLSSGLASYPLAALPGLPGRFTVFSNDLRVWTVRLVD
jgi:hypothetical protein